MLTRSPVNLIFRVWIPILAVIIIIAIGFVYFFRQSELQLLLEHESSEMREVARGIALATELSFKYSDPEAIDVAVRKIAEERNNYKIAVYQRSETGQIVLYATWPANLPVRLYLSRPADYLTVTTPVNSPVLQGGYVSVFLSNDELEAFGDPVADQLTYLIFAVMTILSFIFLSLIIQIGRPVKEVTDFTELLLKGDYSGHLEGTHGHSEIGRLKAALNNLKITLSKEKSRNRELTSGLEFQISRKTHELKTILERLNSAQKIALIGNFNYWYEQDFFEVSGNMNDLMGEEVQDVNTLDSFLEFIHTDFRKIVHAEIQKALSQRSRIRIDFQTNRKIDQDYQWVTLVGEVLTAEQASCLTGTMQDITMRKQIESRVEQLSQVARLTNNGVLFTDSNNTITWANDSMTKITGYTYDEMIGNQPSMFQSNRTDPEVKAYIRSRLKELKNVRVEIENISKDGRFYWIELHIEPILETSNRAKGFLAIQVDITQRKIQQQELQKTLAKQQELSKMKSRFLTLTSHEFRTPLTSIQATAEVLEILLNSDQQPSKDKVNRYFGRIKSELERLTLLLNDILAIERYEAGRIPFNPVELDLNELLKEVLDSRILLPNDNRSILISQSGAPRKIKMDRQLISQIITNLATNALKYSPGKPAPELILDWGESALTLTVKDSGIGIPQIDQQNLFQTFFRASNVDNIQGTGLGLVIVRQFTELHGGKISIESVVNVGTCVKLEFVYQNLEILHSNIA